jgi:hypothetical protein
MAFTPNNKRVIAASFLIIIGFAAARLLSTDPMLAAIYTACLCSGLIPLAWLERRYPQHFHPLLDVASVVFASVAVPTFVVTLGFAAIESAFLSVAIVSAGFSFSSMIRLLSLDRTAVQVLPSDHVDQVFESYDEQTSFFDQAPYFEQALKERANF